MTRYQQIVHWFQNHKFFSWIVVGVAFLAGIGSIVGALDSLVGIYQKYYGTSTQYKRQMDRSQISAIPSTKVTYAYLYDVEGQELEALNVLPDIVGAGNRSTIIILENGTPLGESNASHIEIINLGGGRYSHWLDNEEQEYLLFSTPDNSDPRINEREYVATTASGVSINLVPTRIEKYAARSFGYRYPIFDIDLGPSNSDCEGNSSVSKLMIHQDIDGVVKKLWPAHSPVSKIVEEGEGRFNHCRDGTGSWIYFSTSDNKNPKEGPRTYYLSIDVVE